jgi:shikimate dehydrogenase
MTDKAMLKVTGETKLYIVIGDPIAQVQSTHLYNKMCADLGIDAVFVPVQFAIEDFVASIAGFRATKNLCGIIPTIPHKTRMLDVVDEASARSKRVGAVNSIRVDENGRWIGDAFDGVGYVAGLKANGHDPKGKSVQLVGAGGAGASIAFALAEAGAAHLRLFDTDFEKAQKVIGNLTNAYPKMRVETGPVSPAGMDIVANATPVGMNAGDPFPIDPGLLETGQIVTDMIMKPAVTPLLIAAQKVGCRTVPGYEALKGQAKANMSFFGLGQFKQT